MFNMMEDTENLPNPADLSQIPSHRRGRETTNVFQEQFGGCFLLSLSAATGRPSPVYLD